MTTNETPNDPSEFRRRMATLATAFGLASVVGFSSAALRQLLASDAASTKANSAAAKTLASLGESLLSVTADIAGLDRLSRDSPAVFVCNHQNILDILMLGHVFPENCVVMAKQEFLLVPLMGQFLYMAENIFICRENKSSAKKTMQFVADEMKRKNVSIFMFPEGTRSNQTDNSLLPFKQGAFRLAIEAQIPIIPIVISTYQDVCNPRKGLFKGGQVKIKVLPPIPTVGKSANDAKILMNSTRDVMLETLRDISEPIQLKSKL
ncbi:1-acylglycerol-3-phosphate O-acyltransferase [Podochytrium sp. JEL0797]|nr:1-acylglycerol-3-phosphate O-acyltransferase [Podochytrium sp. JEL0797]